MRDKQPGGVLAEGQRQPVKELMRAQPDVLVFAPIQRRLKRSFIRAAYQAVRAISADQQIASRERFDFADVGVKAQLDAQCAAARLQDVEKGQPRDAAEAIAA